MQRYFDNRFETFDSEQDKELYDVCYKYAEEFDPQHTDNGLMIIGNYGTGKTHLVSAIANKILDDGICVIMDSYTSIIEKLYAEMNSDVRIIREELKHIQLLILDDVGKEKATEWSDSLLFDVIDYRYQAKLPIIITSNLKVDELSKYLGGAVFSRLCEMCQGVITKGENYRQK